MGPSVQHRCAKSAVVICEGGGGVGDSRGYGGGGGGGCNCVPWDDYLLNQCKGSSTRRIGPPGGRSGKINDRTVEVLVLLLYVD